MTPHPPATPPPTAPAEPQPAAPASKSAGAAQILQKYGTYLKTLVDHNCKQAIDPEKIYQTAAIRRNDFYYRGNQHLTPTFSGANGDIVDYKPVGSQMVLGSGNSNKKQTIRYDYVINHFRGDIRKLIGVLGSKSPNVKAMSSWASDETGVTKSNIANDCASYLKSEWDVDAANRALVMSLGKNGTTFLYTPFVADADRYGERTEPVWGSKSDCPECGYSGDDTQTECPECGAWLDHVPAVVDEKSYPNGSVELHVYSGYNVTTAFYIRDFERECKWLWLDGEDAAGWLCSQYPDAHLEEDLRKAGSSMSGGGAAQDLTRLAREQASSPTGYSVYQRPNRWNHSRFWLKPSMYSYLITSGMESGDAQSAAAEIKQVFPRGMKLTFVNNRPQPVKIEHERLDEVWAAVKPETGEFLYADALFNDYIQGADIVNDAYNLQFQLMETSVPITFYWSNVLSRDKIRGGFGVNEYIPVKEGTQMGNAFFRGPTSDFKPQMVDFQKVVIGSLREIIGLMPAIWGGEGVPNETAEAARRRLNQSLMVLSTTWNEMRGGWARAYRNGVRQLARYSLGKLVSSQGDPESVTVREISDIQTLLSGGWYFECDQAVPMSWTQIRDFVESLYQNPAQAQSLGGNDPDNLAIVNSAMGVSGWKIPGAQERSRVHGLIAELMQEAPIMDPNGQPLPSRPLDFQIEWTANIVVPIIHDWIMSDEGKAAEGTPGYQNVMAAGLAALHVMNPMPGPGLPPPKPGGGPPGGAPPPGQVGSANPSPTLPEQLPGTGAPAAPEGPLPPLPQQAMPGTPPQAAVQ